MKRLCTVAAITLTLAGCGSAGTHSLVAVPQGGEGYSLHINSGPFQAGKMTEYDVVQEYMTSKHLCPAGYDVVNIHRMSPENPSLVFVDALVRCKAAGQ